MAFKDIIDNSGHLEFHVVAITCTINRLRNAKDMELMLEKCVADNNRSHKS